jgi:hypothetical protein
MGKLKRRKISMKIEYIKNGRFDKAVWLNTEDADFLTRYSNQNALSIGKAMELWQGLTKALVEAGQAGTLDAGFTEYTNNTPENRKVNLQRMASRDMYEALKYADELIKIARQYFPKSIKTSDKFTLENTCAAIGKALAKAEGEIT